MINKIELGEIPGRCCNYNNAVSQDVLDFHKSEWSACEVNIGKYKNCHSAFAAYKEAVKRLKVGVKVTERKGRLFLIKEG